MPLYDFECKNGHITESIQSSAVKVIPCPHCKGQARKIISWGGHYTGNKDAQWLKSVHEIIDKRPHTLRDKPMTREFLKNPTRRNHRAWMKERNIQPLERGDEHNNPVIRDVPTKKLWERYRKRMATSVG